MTTYSLWIETEPAHADVRFLLDRLYFYNVERTGRDDGQEFAIFSRDPKDRIMAGLHGWTWGGWLKVNYGVPKETPPVHVAALTEQVRRGGPGDGSAASTAGAVW